MFLEGVDVGIGDLFRAFRQLFRIGERGSLFLGEAAVVSGFEGFPIFGRQDSLRRSEMMLRSIVAAIQ